MGLFTRAEKSRVFLKIGMMGPSGGGKTYSALSLASGLGKNIALVDTENKSASLYSDTFSFDSAPMKSPYLIDKYVRAIDEAVAEKYDVLILDSISHAWAGEGGLLAKKEALDARGGNSFANWAKVTPEHEKFKAKILDAQIHIICTIRSKQDYVMDQNDKGKQSVKKVGLAPIQREGFEYELTTVFDIAMDHNAIASKDRTGLFDNQIFKISKNTGTMFLDWLNVGVSRKPDLGSPDDIAEAAKGYHGEKK